MTTAPTVKRMKLRYAGTCSRCGVGIGAGVLADYDREAKTVACVGCAPRVALAEPVEPAEPAELTGPAEQSPAPQHAITPTEPVTLDAVDGLPGASARREFERRHDARQARVQANHPKIGKFLLAVFDDPQSIRAWEVGAVGEQALGEMLARSAGSELRVLHDRRIPKTRANIDHLAVCSSGVYVIDAKRYRDSRPQLRHFGGLLRPREELLYVGGRDRTKLVAGMHKQLGLVKAALADRPEVPVHGVLCFLDADWPVFGGSFVIGGVHVLWPKKLRAMLTEPGTLDADQIADLQWQLHEAFPRQNGK
ncbi:nuclease-related domain-containing protein [Propionicimonas sp.]|uniref:nuclease-related domain-containing protein n=1 Tax=Propionicimonas sp. TaxID=1955623 RepID=UPI0025CF58D0|nr:nuclease-related domain-containing protein [Propionicimonas sp.]MCG2804654.1 NERD domain-containing protein [Propionicimonas sp.]